MIKKKFIVDAALLQELGERLIGRPAIALGELVKNSYDADATTCRIEVNEDEITVTDDGDGMSEREFLDHWMRLGTTHKIDQGTSKRGRPLTGSKGIGRLSAQFLAGEMTLESTSEMDDGKSLYAIVDWKNVVRGADLNTVSVEYEPRTDHPKYPNGSRTGTRITLTNLKGEWDADALRGLGDEVWMLRSPFRHATTTETRKRAPEEFLIEIEAPQIEGARDAFDERLQAVFSNWKARIRGRLEHGRSGAKASITVEFEKGYPEGSGKLLRFPLGVQMPLRKEHGKPLVDRVSFEVLIFKPEGMQRGNVSVGDLRDYLGKFGNVSVYDAGFRLPYYGAGKDAAGQDWLNIALDQGRRLNASELLPKRLRISNKYMQDLPALGRIFGAVEIDTNHERKIATGRFKASPGEWLQMQPGRDRLHDNPAFEQLRDLVRLSLDFYANRFRLLSAQVDERDRESEPASKKYARALEILERNREEIPERVYKEVTHEIKDARKASETTETSVDRRAALLAPLASAGMIALALNHELSRESSFLQEVGARLRRLAKSHSIDELAALADQFDEAKQRLDSLQEVFAPLLSESDKAATDRLRVRAVVEQAVRSMKVLMPGVEFDISEIPRDLHFPLGSMADWNALFQNVLANAWNAMLDSKKRVVSIRGGEERNGEEWVRVSDTGQGLSVPLARADKLFEPFERQLTISRNNRSIAIGGQGLGLAIVRMIANRRSVNVRFVEPGSGFATTVAITWRGVRK